MGSRWKLPQCLYLLAGQITPLAWGEVIQTQITDRNSDQAQGWMPDRRSHPPHLAISAFVQSDF
jgi:hypothetical protein